MQKREKHIQLLNFKMETENIYIKKANSKYK